MSRAFTAMGVVGGAHVLFPAMKTKERGTTVLTNAAVTIVDGDKAKL